MKLKAKDAQTKKNQCYSQRLDKAIISSSYNIEHQLNFSKLLKIKRQILYNNIRTLLEVCTLQTLSFK